MTNTQGYGVWWDDTDCVGRELKCHRYFNTLSGANDFADMIKMASPKCNARVGLRGLMSDDQMLAAERSLIQKLNRDELTRLMLEFGFTIRAKDFANWRPTRRIKTSIPGVWEYVELIATDGILGIFLNEHNEPIYGHIQFVEGVKTLYPLDEDKTKTPKPKKLSKRQQILQSI